MNDYTAQGYKPYDATVGDGPWGHEMPADRHSWNGRPCLETMVESDVLLSNARGITFAKHHAKRCNIESGGVCRDANGDSYQASDELIAGSAVGPYDARPFQHITTTEIVTTRIPRTARSK
jgi:hypothetical protein